MSAALDTLPRVLVVDDDAGSRLLMRSALERGGFLVAEASDGVGAVAALTDEPYDAVLLDVEMPGLDGFAACVALRRLPHGANLPIMMVTGRNDVASVDRAYEVGATDFLAKPIPWSLIAHRVRYLVRSGKLLQALDTNERRQRAVLNSLPDQLLIVDVNNVIVDQLGARSASALDCLGRPVNALAAGDGQHALLRSLALSRAEDRSVELEFGTPTPAGDRHFDARIVPYDVDRSLLVLRDVTDRHVAQARIHELAYFDTLTRLPNREFFAQSVRDALAEVDADAAEFAVVRIAVEGLKRIGDRLGAAVSDELSVQVARRLQTTMQPRADGPVVTMLARVDRSDFALLVRNVSNSAELQTVWSAIQAALAAPLSVSERQFVVTARAGAALFPAHGNDAESLTRAARAALAEARRVGSSGIALFDAALEAHAIERLELESDLRGAIQRGELHAVFQPQVDIQTGRMVGAEALLRWRHPVRGAVPPSVFIPIAEQSGLIEELSDWVMRTALAHTAQWRSAGVVDFRCAVNVSALHFASANFPRWIAAHLAAAGLPGSALEVEITESVLVVDEAAAARTLDAVRKLGVHVAIDDFGTGYSSLAYLKNFALEALKVDRSFVAALEAGGNSTAICGAIVAIGRTLGLRVVAEGVETLAQLRLLRAQGCALAQGYLLAKPMSVDDMKRLIERCTRQPDALLADITPDWGGPALSDSEAQLVLDAATA